ncbi:MAG: alpha/beta hydrolase [Candidatus Binataceae bacterium]
MNHTRHRLVVLIALSFATLIGGCSRARTAPNQDASLGGDLVSFTTEDGVTLRGHLYGRGTNGIILAHMYPADQSDWTDFAQVLSAHGYQALTFDFRGFTESDGSLEVHNADRDLQAAYDFMKLRVARMFLAGASMGADASILVATREPVAGVILLSTPIRFRGLDVEQAITRVNAPMLFIESAGDVLVAGEPQILFRSAHPPKYLKVFPGAAHGTSILRGPYAPQVQSLILRFIEDHSAGAAQANVRTSSKS